MVNGGGGGLLHAVGFSYVECPRGTTGIPTQPFFFLALQLIFFRARHFKISKKKVAKFKKKKKSEQEQERNADMCGERPTGRRRRGWMDGWDWGGKRNSLNMK